jgi:hypothetical protein
MPKVGGWCVGDRQCQFAIWENGACKFKMDDHCMKPKDEMVTKWHSMEYVTTSERWREAYEERVIGAGLVRTEANIPNPVVPKGEGWELVSSVASESRLFWTWKRSKELSEDEGDK